MQAGCRARYRPTKNAAELAAEQMRSRWAGDRIDLEVVRRFVGPLDPADKATLRALLGDPG